MMKTFHRTTTAAITTIMVGTMFPGVVMGQTISQSTGGTMGGPKVLIALQEPATNVNTAQKRNFQKGKIMLKEMLTRLEKHFENIKGKAATLQKLTEYSGIDIVQTIEKYLSQIQEFKARTEAATANEELQSVAQDVHNLILDAKLEVKKNVSNRVETRIDRFTQKTEQAEKLFRLAQQRIDALKTQRGDIESINNEFRGCQSLMEQGKKNLQDAKNKLREFQKITRDQQEEGAQLMGEGIKNVQEARVVYGQARQNCSKVMKELKVLKD
jgi:hypothetical protein